MCSPGMTGGSIPFGCAYALIVLLTFFLMFSNSAWLILLITELIIGWWFEERQNHSNYELWKFEGNEFTTRQLKAPVETLKVIDIADIRTVELAEIRTEGGTYYHLNICAVNNTFTIAINAYDGAYLLEYEIKDWLNLE